jgi:protein-S-isoprenylcysteine O-methyltransferase Ste14
MYASEILFWLGWVAFYGSITVLIFAVIFWAFLNFYAIPHEERALQERFGENYLLYMRTVPRWFKFPTHLF